ncbi:CapA family protein [Alkalicoccus daliensis]|uniref:Sugar-transfer associated ATP-grasp n=1 Tax=Alkalicoccus daliensis TaxID=745820 RepID=A0A1H0GI84_9BACI|nr:CapA family protein [Alkalicoccus daliensis]SDO06543.1 Sugar-transfer associated ATP-grasp [Alkalicoccus daliensis]
MKQFTLSFAGDTSIGDFYFNKTGRELLKKRLEEQPLSFFEKVIPITENSDYFFLNLETTLLGNPEEEIDENNKKNWDSLQRSISLLKDLGVTGVNLANDHTMKFGVDKAQFMKQSLENQGIKTVGAGNSQEEAEKPIVWSLEGENSSRNVYVLSGLRPSKQFREQNPYFAEESQPGWNALSTNKIVKQIEKIKEEDSNSIIVVSPHWIKNDYQTFSLADKYQELCQNILKAGADIVLGHGTHTVSPIERNEDGIIIYSLGNYVFNSVGRFKSEEAPPYGYIVNLEVNETEDEWSVEPLIYPIATNNKSTKYKPRKVKRAEFRNIQAEILEKTFDLKQPYRFKRKRDQKGHYFITEYVDKLLAKYGSNVTGNMYKKYEAAKLLTPVDEDFAQEVTDYWQELSGKQVDPALHIAFQNLVGRKEVRVMPREVMRFEVIPYFNIRGKLNMYADKNLYDMFFQTDRLVKSVLKRVRENYFTGDNQHLNKEEAWNYLLSQKEPVIIKPTVTNNGVGINKIYFENGKGYIKNEEISIETLEEQFGPNFVIQEVLKQHPIMAEPHPSSVNSLRMVTLRWKGEIKYLLTFARFGANDSVNDNAGTGGVCLGITDEGEFMDFAVDEHARKHVTHPTSGYSFANEVKIPNFDEYIKFVKELHEQVLHQDYISWDIAVGEDEKPILIEANFSGATWLYQLASQRSVFGDLTEEVISHVMKERKERKGSRDHKPEHFYSTEE